MTRSPRDRVVLATHNTGKLAEMQRILAPLVPGVEVLGLDDVPAYDEPVESEATFAGNALIKARAAVTATGLLALADDSGICVDALNGMPGVLSARWAGVGRDDRRNNELLLAQLREVPQQRRGAHFCCAVALCRPDGLEETACGEMRGRIIEQMRGSAGFGYDVVFAPEGYARTTAELPAADKDALSHRGQALRAIAPLVAAALRR
jgi:XTP/dITP diphosphohydrolase